MNTTDKETLRQLTLEAVKATQGIRKEFDEVVMKLLVDKINELQGRVEELENIQKEALGALKIADKFCGEHTSDECSDSIHIPIQDSIKKIMKYRSAGMPIDSLRMLLK